MSEVREAAARAAAAQYLTRLARDLLAGERDVLAAVMMPGDRIVARHGGVPIGTVTMTDPKPVEKVTVTDEGALLSWCRVHAPEAVIETVAPWFTAPGNLAAVIAQAGEVPDGVEVVTVTGEPTVTVRLSAAQREALAAIPEVAALGRIGRG